MTENYNAGGPPRTLIGNWQEERTLMKPDPIESTSRDVHNPNKRSEEVQSLPTPPRTRLLRERMRREAEETVTREREATLRRLQERPPDDSLARATFRAHRPEQYASATGRRVMKTMDGEPIPPERRDEEFLARAGISIRRPKLAPAEIAAARPPGDYRSEPAVTFYSQRLPEGVFPSTAPRGANPFGRSTTFSNDIQDGQLRHADAADEPGRRTVYEAAVTRAAAGADLAVRDLVDRVRRALRRAGGASGSLTLAHALRAADATRDGFLSQEEIEAILRRLELPVNGRDVKSLMSLADTNHDGLVSVGELLSLLRGRSGLAGARAAIVDAAFNRLDRAGNGWVSTESLAVVFRATAHPRVQSGECEEKDAILELLRAVDDANPRDDRKTTKDEFTSYHELLSIGIEEDDAFCSTVRTMWGLSEADVAAAAPSAAAAGGGSALPRRKVRVRHLNGLEEDYFIEDRVGGLLPSDEPAIRARLRREGVTHVHSVWLVD